MKTTVFRAVGLLLTVLVTGCSGTSSTSTTAPTTTSTSTSDAFSGSLQVGGLAAHAFTISTSGTISATITSLSAQTAVVGLGIGAYDASTSTCNLITGVNTTTGASALVSVTSALLSTTVSTSGTYCVEIYDVGTLATGFPGITGTTSFTISITRPT